MTQCAFCDLSEGRYQCPRCHAPYCSLKCYRGQGHVQCSESFYEESVKQELELRGGSAGEDRKKVLEALQREHNHDEGEDEDEAGGLDSDDEDDLADRLAGVDLEADPEEVWRRMTSAERADFERAVATGEIAKLLPEFRPWWEEAVEENGASKVEEIPAEGPPSEQQSQVVPAVERNIPDFPPSLKPSPSVRYGVANALYAYCYAVRYFGGDHASQAREFSSLVTEVSSELGGGGGPGFDSFDLALESAAQRVNSGGRWAVTPEMTRGAKKDAAKVMRGGKEKGDHLRAALSDLKRCLILGAKKGRKKVDNDQDEASHPPPWAKKDRSSEVAGVDPALLKRAAKKVDFYLSWSRAHGERELEL